MTDAGGVDEVVGVVVGVDEGIDGIACGAGLWADDGALFFEDVVEESGLADVGSADDGHLGVGSLLWEVDMWGEFGGSLF